LTALKKSKLLIFILLTGLFQPLFAQEDIIKSYADSSSRKDYCFYPSTLRMLNLAKNKDYYDMVENIKKILIYTLDSASIAEKSYLQMIAKYQKNAFEEYAIMQGGDTNFYIYGKEDQQSEFVGVFRNKEEIFAFYIIGKIGFQKIPTLVQSISQGEMFNVYSIISPYAK
jgi:hypothetical protein